MSETLILELPVIPAKRAEFVAMLEGVLPDTRAYDGAIQINLWTPQDDDGKVLLYEI